tara:strand:+ start:4584 stop:5318 length:735 start_codon:yes stop_codon:yes gene_type:complete
LKFKNKIAVVTGGFTGTGKVIVDKLIKSSAKVYSLDKMHPGLKKKKNLISYKIDLSDHNQIKNFSKYIYQKESRVDFLINNAGISLPFNKKNIFEYWNQTLNTNLSSAFFISNFLIDLLKKSKYASIVNIGSISSRIAMAENQAYNISKSGLIALTFSQAMDYKNFKIRSNCISPGYIKTAMTKKSFFNKKKYKERINRIMLKQYGESTDIAEMVMFLCSKKSKYINAENIIIDGGLTRLGIEN